MDLLRYTDTKLTICLKDKSRREVNDILRQLLIHPERIQICPCSVNENVWIRKTLEFLGAQINNEPSH